MRLPELLNVLSGAEVLVLAASSLRFWLNAKLK
jgi:hypothetical protein